MKRNQFTAEDRAEQLTKLIDARTEAIENDIALGRKSTIEAVAGHLIGVKADEEELVALIRAAVVCGSTLVGRRIAGAVSHAIYCHALPLADGDFRDVERTRQQSRDEHRIDNAEWARAMH